MAGAESLQTTDVRASCSCGQSPLRHQARVRLEVSSWPRLQVSPDLCLELAFRALACCIILLFNISHCLLHLEVKVRRGKAPLSRACPHIVHVCIVVINTSYEEKISKHGHGEVPVAAAVRLLARGGPCGRCCRLDGRDRTALINAMAICQI